MARYGLGALTYPRYGYYNGSNNPNIWPSSQYGLGAFRWDGGREMTRANAAVTTQAYLSDPTFGISPGTAPRAPNSLLPGARYMKTPRVVKASSGTYRMYVDTNAKTGGDWKIGLLTATDPLGPWTWYGYPTGLPTHTYAGDFFPIVIEDPDDIASRRWKMWFGHGTSWADNKVCYAYSADGLAWTQYGTVIPDAIGLPGSVVRVDGEWFLYYSVTGSQTPGVASSWWSARLARFTNPESTYSTRSVISPLANTNYFSKSTTLTSNALVGATSFTVADATKFAVGDPIYVGNGSASQFHVDWANITAITGSTITVAQAMVDNHYSGDGVVHCMERSTIPSFVHYDPDLDVWRMLLTAFQASNAVAFETGGMVAEAPDPEGPWAYRMADSPMDTKVSVYAWDGVSAENRAFIIDATDPLWSMLYTSDGSRAATGKGTNVSQGHGAATGVALGSLTIAPSAYWTQAGDALTVTPAAVGVTYSVAATIVAPVTGPVVFDGTHADRFTASLDGITYASSITVPVGTSTIRLAVTSQSGDTVLFARVGVPSP